MKIAYRDNHNPVRFFKRIKQVNNLVIYQDNSVGLSEFKVATFDKRILEEFCSLKDAEAFCKKTFDFVKHKKVILELYVEIWHCYEDGKGMAYSLFTTTELQEAEAICRDKKYEIVQMIDLELQDLED